MPASNSPFNWRSQPSILANDHDINGINRRKSLQASALKKTPFILSEANSRTPHNQVNSYGRAVVSKTKASLGL